MSCCSSRFPKHQLRDRQQQQQLQRRVQFHTRTARAGSEEHAGCQYHPGNVRPHGGIVVKQSRGGDEGYHLEDGAAEGMFHIVVAHRHQLYHNEGGECRNQECIELELRVLEQVFNLELDDCCIKQGEVHSREKAEERTDVFQCRRMEERGTAVMSISTRMKSRM